MNLQFIGYGSAFNPSYGNTSACFTLKNALFVLDCGEQVFHQLYERFPLDTYHEIYVFITHTHGDHVGSLATLISYSKIVLQKQITVICPNQKVENLLSLMGISSDCYSILSDHTLQIGQLQIRALPVEHAENIDCYGYLLTDSEKRIYYSGDSYSIPDMVIQLLEKNELDELYQDTTECDTHKKSHMSLTELAKVVRLENRSKVYCMHFSNDFSVEIKKMGFRSVVDLI